MATIWFESKIIDFVSKKVKITAAAASFDGYFHCE